MAANGMAGGIALLVAVVLRIRTLSAFGFRGTERKRLAAGVVLGVLAFGLSFIVECVYFLFVTEPNTQGEF